MLASILGAVAAALKAVAAYITWARDRTLVALGAAQERNASSEAQAATQEILKEVADERASIPDPATDNDDIAGELRKQKTGNSSVGSRRRPF
jgi:hypothetical protein